MKFPPVKMTYKIQVPSHMKIAFKFVVTIQYESNNDRRVDILCERGTGVVDKKKKKKKNLSSREGGLLLLCKMFSQMCQYVA